jgi:hypothetical protein
VGWPLKDEKEVRPMMINIKGRTHLLNFLFLLLFTRNSCMNNTDYLMQRTQPTVTKQSETGRQKTSQCENSGVVDQ